MAITFHDVFIRIRSDFDDAARGFSRAKREIGDLKTATDEASKSAGFLHDQARRLSKAEFAMEFDRKGARDLIKDLESIDEQLARLESRKISVDPEARRRATEAREAIREQIRAQRDYLEELRKASAIEIREQKKITAVKASLRKLDTAAAKRELSDLQKAQQTAHRAELKRLNDQRKAREGQALRFLPKDIERNLDVTRKLLGGLGGGLETAANKADSLMGKVERFGGVLTRISPIMRGVTLLLSSAMLPALVAIGGALTAVVGGLAGMAAAAAAALIPLVALFTGFMSRFAAVGQAVKAQAAAQKEAAQNAKDAADRQEQAADAAEAAADGVRSAAEAQRDAGRAVREAVRGLADANEEAAEAAEELGRAEVDALREIEDAAERARDAVLDLEGAHLGVERANLNLLRAKERFRELGKEAGLTTATIDDMFQKFSDVDFRDTEALEDMIRKAGAGAGGTGVSALDMRDAALDVAEAEHGVKVANEEVSDSERDKQDAQKESARLQREGIAGVDSYRAALEAVESANDNVRDSERGVAAARRAQRDSIRDYAEALEEQREVMADQAEVLRGSTTAMEAYQQQLADLSAAERRFAQNMIAMGDVLKGIVQAGTDPIFNALSDLIPKFAAFVPYLTNLSGQIGRDAAANIKALAGQFLSLKNLGKIDVIAQLSRDMANLIGGPIARNLSQAFLDAAAAFAPGFMDVMRRIVGWTEQIRDGMSGLAGSSSLDTMVAGFNALLDGIEAAWAVLKGLFASAAGPGLELVKWITDGAKAWGEWASSAEGQEKIGNFLRTMIPFIKSLVRFLIQAGDTAFEIFETIAPFLGDILDGVTVFLKGVDLIFSGINAIIPDWLRSLILGILTGTVFISKLGFLVLKLPKIFAKIVPLIRVPIGLLIAGFQAIGQAWEAVFSVIETVWDWIKGAFEDAVNWIEDFLGIGSPSQLFIDIGQAIADGLWEGLKSLGSGLFDLGKKAVRTLIRGIKLVAAGLYNAGKWVVERVVDGIEFLGDKLLEIGEWIVRRTLRGIRNITTFIFAAGKWIVEKLVDGIEKVVKLLTDVGKWILEKVWAGIKAVPGILADAGKWIIDKIVGSIEAAGARLVGWGRWIAGKIKEGIVSNPVDLFEWIFTPFQKLQKEGAKAFSDIGNYFGQMFTAGMGTGIAEGAAGPARQVADVGTGMFNIMSRVLRVRSPSQVMHYIGLMTMKGLAQGIRDGADAVHGTLVKAAGPDALGALVGDIKPAVELAAGGIVGRATWATIGEGTHKEAVLPLSRTVFGQLGRAISSAMAIRGPGAIPVAAMGAGTASGGPGYTIQKMDIVLPPAPGYDQMGDPRHQAMQFARELSRRGQRPVGTGGLA